VEGKGCVLYEVQRLPLLEGLYRVSVSVRNRDDTEMYDSYDRYFSLRIIISPNNSCVEKYGKVTLFGSWSIYQ
jgi:hypothetical protein